VCVPGKKLGPCSRLEKLKIDLKTWKTRSQQIAAGDFFGRRLKRPQTPSQPPNELTTHRTGPPHGGARGGCAVPSGTGVFGGVLASLESWYPMGYQLELVPRGVRDLRLGLESQVDCCVGAVATFLSLTSSLVSRRLPRHLARRREWSDRAAALGPWGRAAARGAVSPRARA